MVMPFLSLYLTSRLGLTTQTAGLVLSLYGVGAVFGAYGGGWLTDHVGSFRAQLLSLVAAGFGFWLLGHADSRVTVTAMIFLVAIAAESFRPSNGAAVAEWSTGRDRFRAYALRRLAINLGMTAGPAAGGFLAAHDYKLLFWVNGLTCFLAAAFLWLFFRRRTPPSQPREDAAGAGTKNSAWNDRPFLALLLIMTIQTTIFFQLFSTWSLTVHEHFGLPERSIGLLIAINTLVIVATEMVLIDLVRVFSTVRVIAVGAFLICAGLGMLAFGGGMVLLVASLLVWTTGEMLSFPLIEGLIGNRAPPAARGQYMGLFTGTFSVAFILAPTLGTWLYQTYSYRTLWAVCGFWGLVLPFAYLALERHFQAETKRAGET